MIDMLRQIHSGSRTHTKIPAIFLGLALTSVCLLPRPAAAEEPDPASPAPPAASLEVSVKGLPPGTAYRLTLDGAEVPAATAGGPIRVSPGEHVIDVSAGGHWGARQTITLADAALRKVEVHLFPADSSAQSQLGAGGAGTAPGVPAAVRAMVGRLVVLRTKGGELTGRLLSADGGGLSLETSDHVVIVPRKAALGVRLVEKSPGAAPPKGVSTPDGGSGEKEPRTDDPSDTNLYTVAKPSAGKGAVTTGAILFSGLWGASIGYAAVQGGLSKEDGWWPLYIPVAGPFVAVETLKSDGAGTALLLLNGAVQATGLLTLIVGVAQGKSTPEDGALKASAGPSVRPVLTGNGIGLAGTF